MGCGAWEGLWVPRCQWSRGGHMERKEKTWKVVRKHARAESLLTLNCIL